MSEQFKMEEAIAGAVGLALRSMAADVLAGDDKVKRSVDIEFQPWVDREAFAAALTEVASRIR